MDEMKKACLVVYELPLKSFVLFSLIVMANEWKSFRCSQKAVGPLKLGLITLNSTFLTFYHNKKVLEVL